MFLEDLKCEHWDDDQSDCFAYNEIIRWTTKLYSSNCFFFREADDFPCTNTLSHYMYDMKSQPKCVKWFSKQRLFRNKTTYA